MDKYEAQEEIERIKRLRRSGRHNNQLTKRLDELFNNPQGYSITRGFIMSSMESEGRYAENGN